MQKPIECVLFDLDGTLLDTSYDFAYALKKTCEAFNRPVVDYSTIRNTVSQGGLAVTQLAFADLTGDALEEKRQFFLEVYFNHIALHTDLFPGLHSGLEYLAENEIPWGIVTNKPTWLTKKLLESFVFPSEPYTVICGDTLKVRKPDPEPMLLAAKQCGVDPEHCLYLGDHPRDIEAGKNANMQTGSAFFGYLPKTASASDWNADYDFHTPYEISEFIQTL
ncbi:HAD family hydrolase [Thiomicrorhabdus indica]|uniref:HAD family hydrolase n=1 Tax=Thiomicrorhabdus indica TaxID=2267253 RepID=UPI00102D8504|nr:HAD-IA family hydrolase [Thiomicrorhabdus indica]